MGLDTSTIVLSILALTLCFASWHARRLGNDSRDVTALGTVAALLGVGAGVVALG